MTSESLKVADARRHAEQARAKFWASFDDILDYGQNLQESLTPHNLARDAWDAAKSKSADIAEDAVDAVRKRPVAATGAVAALALFIAREPLMDLASKLVSSKGKKKAPAPRKAAGKARTKKVEKIDD
ncbi:MAG TPA: hypothetical protein VFP53_05720 [Sphingomicrobium sp.]|nr:hypothetical protein [Sphingomicrobium sp.]